MHLQRHHLLLASLIWLSSFATIQAQTPTASLTVSNALSCSQLSATLTAATSCTGSVSYRFTGPNDFVLETTSPIVSVTVDGEHTVVASNTATGCTATRSTTLTSTLHPDYLPLVDLYRSTNGPNWTNNAGWLSNCEPCSGWFGIVCWRNQVVFLDLDNNQLKGTLPSSLHQLKTTTSFWFAQNQLQGNIPASLTLCQNMVSLRLNGNQLVGIIPAGVTSLTGLNWLDLSENQLTGIIPQDIDNLTNLGGINLEGNQLTGTVPVGLTALTRLDILRLGDNQLTGPIPSGFGKDGKQMQQFLLQNNRLTGPLPADLGNLTDISYMLLYNNQLSGCIPNSFSALCGRAVNLVGNSGLPNGGDLGPFCASREGSDLFITVSTSGSVVRSGTSIYLRASGGASYTWTAPIGATLTSPAVASSVTAIVSGDGPRNFTLTATNNYCSQTRVSSVITVMHPDYIPLAEFFAATNGPNWLNKAGWLSSLDPCSGWFGVSCQNGRVSSLSLTANQLRGTLPENLTTLPNLQVLDLSGNQLRGCFPVAWTAFCNRTVSLQNNPNLPGGGDWTGFCSNRLGSADFVTIAKAMPNPVSLGGITSLSASGGTLYQWTGPQNFTSNQSVVSLSVSSGEQQGVYSVTVGNGNMSCSAVATTSLTISGVSCVKLSPLVSSSSICTRGIVTLTVSATSPEAVTYQWYKGTTALVNNTATIGATSTTLIMADLPLSATGTYYVVANSRCGSTTSTVFSLSVTPPTHPDYLPLADLFYATKGLLWYNKTNWLTSGDPCNQWAGIYCNENKTRVSNVWLIENGLDGRLPESLSGLTEIGAFNARNNNLTDTIPDCFGWMNQISDVLLNGNQLTGRIPRSLGGRPNLRVLWLQNNQLTGDIPPTMIDSPKLEILSLYNNQLNGNIPGWLGQLPQLFYFDAAFNQLTGSIPTGLSVTKGLTYFSVQGNRLVGSIPRSLSLMLSLQVLNLSFNRLDGTIPEELSALSGLKVLDLGTNRLTGGLPTSFSVLTSLRSLGLNNNQLSGQIPVGWSTMAGLTSLDLSVNQLTGAIPFGMGNMTNLQYFYLSNNQFTSSIPSSLSRLSKLRGLGLQNNQLSGCIPLSLTSLCAQDITVNISNNPSLPGGGDWSAFCSTGAGSYAGTLTTTKAGIWTDGSVWSCGAVPQAGDRVIVQHPVTVTPVPLNFVNQVCFEGAGKLIYETGARLQMK